jgi:hypothetical protein
MAKLRPLTWKVTFPERIHRTPMKLPRRSEDWQEPDAEISRQLGQMASVLVDSLVGVGAHLTGIGQVKGAPRLKPLLEQVAHEASAQPEFGHLVEPGLRHV